MFKVKDFQTDDIHWVSSKINGNEMLSFLTDPYLTIEDKGLSAKLIYSSVVPHGNKSISCMLGDGKHAYRVAYYMNGDEISHVSDAEIQDAAFGIGLYKSIGINSNLSFHQYQDIHSIEPSVKFLQRFSCTRSKQDAADISIEYGVKANDIRLTGGAQINNKELHKQHDIDVVIPLNSLEHAHGIWQKIKSRSSVTRIAERGFISPMRWYSSSGSMICPFFVYNNSMTIPIKSMELIGDFSGEVEIIDASLSLVSMPLFQVTGDIEFVAFRSRIVRAALNEGDKLKISSVLIEVTDGDWKGKRGALVLEPFSQVVNLVELLSRWNA